MIENGRPDGLDESENPDFWDSDDEETEQMLRDWDEAEADAVEVLQHALPELRGEAPPGALAAAAAELRAGLAGDGEVYASMRSAAGWSRQSLPREDRELWLGAAGGLVSAREETLLEAELEATLMALDMSDWLGAVVELVRAGAGASAEPEQLVRNIDNCPEVEGEEVEVDDRSLIETAFEVILPAWEACGAIDRNRRLTALGRWGLPRALAWAWNGDFDAPPAGG
ncbi:MAG: hypothetical protein M3024_02025 [Candidatus Dormibacteraeota bacterium]|nr:hypothetical protein [Candidatus Dormibacteraeota bacterium]